MKVLIVTPHVFAGGAEKAILNLVYRLNSLGCDAQVASLSLDLSKLPSKFGGLTYLLPERPLEMPVLDGVGAVISSSVREFFAFVGLLKRYSDSFDLVCVCNFPSYWASYFVRVEKPVIWFSSEVLAPYNQTKDLYDRSPFFRLALRVASAVDKHIVQSCFDYIITCSSFNSRLVRARYGRDSVVLLTGVDYDFFNQEVVDAKAKLGLGKGPVLLHVGALMQRKNQILSIRALGVLKRHLGNVKLVIVGEGPWLSALQQEVRWLGLHNDVVFLGCVSEEVLRVAYHACDVNLFPVRDQTWGLVPFEALAAGKISVVAKGAGAAEIMSREKIAIMTEPTVDELAKNVLYALQNPKVTEVMIKKGQRYVKENLTWDTYAQKMYATFKSILNNYNKS